VSRKIQVCVGLFAIALVVFRASPRGQLYDSRYTLLVAHRIVADGALALDPFVEALGGVDGSGRPHDYRLVRTGQQVHWFYPPGTPLLAAPFVALADAAGAGPVDPSGRYDRDAERRMQRWLAAAAMAAAGVLLFLTARQRLPERPSLAVAGAALFATPIWSTASRSLWSQTFALLLLSGAVLLLVRGGSARRGGGDTEDAADGAGDDAPLHPVLLGTLLAWAWLCRPTARGSATEPRARRRGGTARLERAPPRHRRRLPRGGRLEPPPVPARLPGAALAPRRRALPGAVERRAGLLMVWLCRADQPETGV